MNKLISFKKEFITLIKEGKKTVTRRIKFTGNPGDIFYFKIDRNGKKEGYIKIISVKIEQLKEMIYSYGEDESRAEGCRNLGDFLNVWNRINKISWRDNPMVYRIEFKYLGDNIV